MFTLRHLVVHLKRYDTKHKALYFLSFMLLFWAIYDGIISYITPLVIVEEGMSKTLMGIVMAASSVAGALFDFLMCRLFKSLLFRRVFLVMFTICFLYPLILWQAKTFFLYLIAMGLWGIYYDLKSFGVFDFVGWHTAKEEHSSSFGVASVFLSLGYLLAPILAAALIGELVDWKPFVLAWVFLLISLVFFVILLILTRNERNQIPLSNISESRPVNFFAEFGLWRKVGAVIFPVLILTVFLNIFDAFFWTVGPLLAESFSSMHQFAGFFMTAYSLPTLLVGWFVGSVTARLGKKRAAFISFLSGSLVITLLIFTSSPLMMILIVFLASFLSSLAWPAINGAYADYITEAHNLEKEIEGLEDFASNLGYIIGPILAGFLADRVGNAGTFSVLGLVSVIISIFLLKITPKHIIIPKDILKPKI
jgi:MFS family permease